VQHSIREEKSFTLKHVKTVADEYSIKHRWLARQGMGELPPDIGLIEEAWGLLCEMNLDLEE